MNKFIMYLLFKTIVPVLLLVLSNQLLAQFDTLVFTNGDRIVGEIKSLDRGVIKISTDYDDQDFLIDWASVREIYTEFSFQISLTKNRQYYGTLQSVSPTQINLTTEDYGVVQCNPNEVVYLRHIDEGFKDRFSANVDIGFSMTKANDLAQLTTGGVLSYKAKKWTTSAFFNSLRSTQTEAEDIDRKEGGLSYNYLIVRKWYVSSAVSFLSNTEQKLNLRSNVSVGVGRYFVQTNSVYWGSNVGVNRNIENFEAELPDRDSWEGYFGTDIDLYDIGDFSMRTWVKAYPSFTETDRWRTDYNLVLKYDLPLDFYIKADFSINFDNQPADGASRTDYVLRNGFGWEW